MGISDTTSLTELLARHDAEHDLLRQLVLPEEDRAQFTTCKSSGEYRWFRSSNVVCIEKAKASAHEVDAVDLGVDIDGGLVARG